ncbi:MAG: universal stress protein [Acidobacteria bacterium]|nr:universal stress protein [Acidobacteriota bacterium]
MDSAEHVSVIHVLSDLSTEADFIRAAFVDSNREDRARAALEERLSDPRYQDLRLIVRTGVPGEVIATVAQENHCDLIVMPSHGRTGFSRLFLGSVAERVLRLAHCPVLILRTAPSSAT